MGESFEGIGILDVYKERYLFCVEEHVFPISTHSVGGDDDISGW